MNEHEKIAERFEAHRAHLRGVAYRMLGSLTEADDALQEAWLRASGAGTASVENLGGWLTTIVARVCLDMLRSRKARREELHGAQVPDAVAGRDASANAEQEAVLADSVGLALLVVLETLSPAERLAFVLHDLLGVSFDEIAPILGRSEAAARQLASRARRRVQGKPTVSDADLARQRVVVDAFLAALRGGDFDALVAVLDPDLVVRVDATAAAAGAARVVQGAREWAKGAIVAARGARAARVALLDGNVGLVVAPRGHLFRALELSIVDGKIARIDIIGDPATLGALDVAVLDD